MIATYVTVQATAHAHPVLAPVLMMIASTVTVVVVAPIVIVPAIIAPLNLQGVIILEHCGISGSKQWNTCAG